MFLSILGVVSSVFGGITSLFKYLQGFQQRKLGAIETGYQAAKDAIRRAQLHKEISSRIKTLTPNELSQRLRNRVRKSGTGED